MFVFEEYSVIDVGGDVWLWVGIFNMNISEHLIG